MAHSAQINVNGVLTTVTEFDNSAQAIDDAVSNMGAAATPQAALAALGAGVRPNLLDNAYFVGGGSQQGGGQMPINQTGATSWTGNSSYVNVFDRWSGYVSGGGAEFKLTGEGLALPSFGSYVSAVQRMPYSNAAMAGKTYTISAIIGDELITATGKVTATSVTTTFFSGKGSNGNQVRLRYSSTNGMFFEVYAPGGGVVVSYCKLEEGEGQTLAYQDSTGAWHRLPQPEDGDYAGQLLKCQQYLVPMGNAEMRASRVTTSAVRAWFPTPVPMRTDPVLSSGSFQVKTLAYGNVMSGAVWSYQVEGCGVIVTATLASHGQTDGTIYSNAAVLSAPL